MTYLSWKASQVWEPLQLVQNDNDSNHTNYNTEQLTSAQQGLHTLVWIPARLHTVVWISIIASCQGNADNQCHSQDLCGMDNIIIYWQLKNRISSFIQQMLIEHARPCSKPWGPSNKQNKQKSLLSCMLHSDGRRQTKSNTFKIKNVFKSVMANFVSTRLGHRVATYWVKHYSGCFDGGVSGGDSHLNL